MYKKYIILVSGHIQIYKQYKSVGMYQGSKLNGHILQLTSVSEIVDYQELNSDIKCNENCMKCGIKVKKMQ